jgi:hypothetical protein
MGMFAQLRKSATLIEKLTPLIRAKFTPGSVIAPGDRRKESSVVWSRRKSKRDRLVPATE